MNRYGQMTQGHTIRTYSVGWREEDVQVLQVALVEGLIALPGYVPQISAVEVETVTSAATLKSGFGGSGRGGMSQRSGKSLLGSFVLARFLSRSHLPTDVQTILGTLSESTKS